MARRVRTTLAGMPHHGTQCGAGRERIFLVPGDEAPYGGLIIAQLARHTVANLACCFMSDHEAGRAGCRGVR
jgi:hypothetical protein